MNEAIIQRAKDLGRHIARHQATVRDAARVFGISKSTVHKDVTERLLEIDAELWASVRGVLEQNKAERHIRGGEATKRKYLRIASSRPAAQARTSA